MIEMLIKVWAMRYGELGLALGPFGLNLKLNAQRSTVRHPCIKHYYKLIQVNTKLEKFLDASRLTLRPRVFVAAWGSFSRGLPAGVGPSATSAFCGRRDTRLASRR